MRILSKLACVAALGLLISTTAVRAGEIPISKLPDDINQTLATTFPNVTPVKASHEAGRHIVVTVRNKLDNSTFNLVFKIVTVHVLVTLETPVNLLPDAVITAVKTKYPGATILKAEQMTNTVSAPTGYALQIITTDNKKKDVHIAPDGKFFHAP